MWGERAIKENLTIINWKRITHAQRPLRDPRLKNLYEQQRVQN